MLLYIPGTGVAAREGGAEGLRVVLLPTALSTSRGVGVGALFPGFDTTNVTNPSVLFNRLAAYKPPFFSLYTSNYRQLLLLKSKTHAECISLSTANFLLQTFTT